MVLASPCCEIRAQTDPATRDEDLIQLNLPDQVPLDVLIALVSDQLGIRILYDDQVGQNKVTIKSPTQVPKQSLLGILESALKLKGLALVDDDQEGWYRILTTQDLTRVALSPSKAPADLATSRSTLAVTQIFEMSFADPQRVETIISPFLTEPGGNSFILPDQSALVVTDFARNMPRIRELIELVDRAGPASEVRFVTVQHQPVSQIVESLKAITSAQTTPGSIVGREGGPGVSRTEGIPRGSYALSILEQTASNQIILIGHPLRILQVLELLRELDTPSNLDTRIYRFHSTNPQKVDALVRQLIGDHASEYSYRSVIEEDEGLLIVTATPTIHDQVLSLKNEMDRELELIRPVTRFYRLRNTSVQDVYATLRGLMPDAPRSGRRDSVGRVRGQGTRRDRENSIATESDSRSLGSALQNSGDHQRSSLPTQSGVDAIPGIENNSGISSQLQAGALSTNNAEIIIDVNTNTLIITAAPADHERYIELIGHLDQRRPQVLIEVTFVTLDTSNGFSLGVEISLPDDGTSKVLTFSSFGLSEVDADTGALSLIPGLGFNGAIIQPDIADVIIRAIASNGRASVTSAPRLLINDNASGSLNSVVDAPTTSINSSNTVSTTSFAGFESAGTTINITPHISEGDHLQLEYDITLSAFTGESSDGIPPPRQRNEMSSEVTIPDGYTIIIGGLTRTDTSESISRIPILGHIPILEYFFSTRTESSTTTTLFVFMRPIILRDDQFQDLKFLSEQELAAAGLPSPYPSSEPILIH
ncbi:MAG: hypothetical protein O7G85_17655 [Planctomycetota bacterium]|nr:hypothetical protein [Planctomycetota bacterium]